MHAECLAQGRTSVLLILISDINSSHQIGEKRSRGLLAKRKVRRGLGQLELAMLVHGEGMLGTCVQGTEVRVTIRRRRPQSEESNESKGYTGALCVVTAGAVAGKQPSPGMSSSVHFEFMWSVG